MTDWRQIRHQATGEILIPRAKWCAGFWCHLKGLMFQRSIDQDEGLLFVTGGDSKVESTIHMFFMFMDISVIWINSHGIVVDKAIARPWRPMYAPREAAQYYVEAHPSRFEKFQIGDQVEFVKE